MPWEVSGLSDTLIGTSMFPVSPFPGRTLKSEISNGALIQIDAIVSNEEGTPPIA